MQPSSHRLCTHILCLSLLHASPFPFKKAGNFPRVLQVRWNQSSVISLLSLLFNLTKPIRQKCMFRGWGGDPLWFPYYIHTLIISWILFPGSNQRFCLPSFGTRAGAPSSRNFSEHFVSTSWYMADTFSYIWKLYLQKSAMFFKLQHASVDLFSLCGPTHWIKSVSQWKCLFVSSVL